MSDKHFVPMIILGVVILAVLAGGIWYFASLKSSPGTGGIACTTEAMLCPDGSYVGRTGPNCEFAACPAVPSSTTPFANNQYDITLEYPAGWHMNTVNAPSGTFEFDSFVPGTLSEGGVLSDGAADIVVYRSSKTVQEMMADDLSGENTTSSSIVVSGVTGSRVDLSADESGIRSTIIYLSWSGYTYKIILEDKNYPQASDLFNQFLSTFKFIRTDGAFCGGIAAGQFPCADGYSCKLDGTYPDAGGHCVKN